MLRWWTHPGLLLVVLPALLGSPALAYQVEALSEAQQKVLDDNFKLVLRKRKGPYSPNYCVCKDGQKRPVLGDDGSIPHCLSRPGPRTGHPCG